MEKKDTTCKIEKIILKYDGKKFENGTMEVTDLLKQIKATKILIENILIELKKQKKISHINLKNTKYYIKIENNCILEEFIIKHSSNIISGVISSAFFHMLTYLAEYKKNKNQKEEQNNKLKNLEENQKEIIEILKNNENKKKIRDIISPIEEENSLEIFRDISENSIFKIDKRNLKSIKRNLSYEKNENIEKNKKIVGKLLSLNFKYYKFGFYSEDKKKYPKILNVIFIRKYTEKKILENTNKRILILCDVYYKDNKKDIEKIVVKDFRKNDLNEWLSKLGDRKK